MKTYVTTTGVIFLLLVIAHIWRMISESAALATEPWYLAITATALGLSVWAFYLVRRASKDA